MITNSIIIESLIALITITFLMHLIGSFFISFYNKIECRYSTFISLVIGYVITTTLYALIKTNLNSSFFGVIPLGITLVILTRKNYVETFENWKNNFQSLLKSLNIIELIFYTTIIFFVQSLLFVSFDYNSYSYYSGDMGFYARLSDYIGHINIETRIVDYFGEINKAPTPYHYAELWFTSFISYFFKQNAHFNYFLITNSYLILLVIVGIRSLINTNYKLINLFFPLMILFIGGIEEIYPNIGLLNQDLWTSTILEKQKLTIVYVFLILIVFIIKMNNFLTLSVAASILSIYYMPVAPAVFISITIFLTISFLNKKTTLSIAFKSLSILFGAFLFLSIFYYLNSIENNPNVLLEKNSQDPILLTFLNSKEYFNINYLKLAFNIISKTSVQIIICNFVVILIFYFCRNKILSEKNLNSLILISFLLLVISLFLWGVFNKMFESVQLWSNIYIPLVNLITLYSLYVLILKKKLKLFYLICIGFFIVNNPINAFAHLSIKIKKEDFNGLKLFLTKDDLSVKSFAFIKDKSEFNTIFDKSVNIYYPIEPISYIFESYKITCLSLHDLPTVSEHWGKTEEELIKTNPFYHFVERQKINYEFKSIEKSQLDFINKHKIDFLILSPNSSRPVHIESYLGNYYDYNGWKIYKLNYKE